MTELKFNYPTMVLSDQAKSELTALYNEALQTGANTAEYMQLLIQHGKMEARIVNGCKAIIRIARIYGAEQMEAGCKRALLGKRYNYATIKAIMAKGLYKIAFDNDSEVPPQTPPEEHENLRGPDFFEKKHLKHI